MTRIFVAIIAVAVLGGFVFVAWTMMDDIEQDALTSDTGDSPGFDDDSSRSARRSADTNAGENAEGNPQVKTPEGLEVDQATTVEGRLVDEGGAAVGDAVVSLRVGRNMLGEAGEAIIEGSRTGADGRFLLEGVPHGVSLALRARHPDLQDAIRSFRLEQGEQRDLGDLVAAPGGAVSGRVVGPDGVPVVGASLRVYPAGSGKDQSPFALLRVVTGSLETGRTGVTDSDGAFNIGGLEPGKIRIVVNATGHPPAVHEAVEVRPGGETSGVLVTMKPGHELEIVVKNAEGAPLRGASVRLRSAGFDVEDLLAQIHGGQRGETGEDGSFLLEGLGRRSYKLEVIQPGYLEKTVDIDAEQTRVEVELERASLIWGVVTAKHDGTPITDFEITAKGSDHLEVLRGEEAALAASTEEVAGIFAITDNTSDRMTFTVISEGYAHARRTLRDLESGLVREDVALILQVPFAGRVLDTDGEPISGVKVRVSAPVRDDDPEAMITREVERVRERLRAPTRVTRRNGVSDENGEFRVLGLEPGEVTITASSDRFIPSQPETMMLVAGQPVDGHEIVLSRGGRLEGIVRDVDGAPLEGAMVSLDKAKGDAPAAEADDRGMRLISGRGIGGGFKDAVSDKDGRYEIVAIPPGSYRVKVDEPAKESDDAAAFLRIVGLGSGGAETGEPVTFNAEEVLSIDLAIKPRARIVGVVTAAGAGVEGVRVQARTAEPKLSLGGQPGAETDVDGGFVIDDIKPGRYRVTAKPPGSPSPMTVEVDVQPGADAIADFELPGGVIRGRVIEAATGDGVAGAEVWARGKGKNAGNEMEDAMNAIRVAFDTGSGMRSIGGGGGSSHRIVSDEKGYYELPYVTTGDYTVSCRHADFIKPGTIQTVAVDGEITDGIDFSLTLGGTLEVVVENPTEDSGPFGFHRFSLQRVGSDDKPVRKTNLEPNVRFEGLEPGTYEVSVRSGSKKGEGTVVVQAGYAETLTLRVQ